MRYLTFYLLFLVSCSNCQTTTPTLPSTYDFPYDLSQPDKKWKLKQSLEEISGLGLSPNNEVLYAIQDEDGILYSINPSNGKIMAQQQFYKKGDYEGVETVGDTVFVVKSSGTLYAITDLKKDKPSITKYNGHLDKTYDVEALCYDEKNQRLLLGCKAKAGEGKVFHLKKAIYAFDLTTMQLDSLPTYLIALDDIHQYLNTNPTTQYIEQIVEYINPNKSVFTFGPSAMAIHPVSGDLYILSSPGKILLVMSPEGNILHIEKLNKGIHSQPEGIAFDTLGTLFIANEGKKKRAKIYKYRFESTKEW